MIVIENKNREHHVLSFFEQFRSLCNDLQNLGVGYGLTYPVDSPFPPTYLASAFGIPLSEKRLQKRTTMLENWMKSIFKRIHTYPIPAQILFSEFLSLKDGNEERENNKNEILAM